MKKTDFPFVVSSNKELHPAGLSGNATNAICRMSGAEYFNYHAKNPKTEEILGLLKGRTSYELMSTRGVGMKTAMELSKFVTENI
jgi:hypothetical protein